MRTRQPYTSYIEQYFIGYHTVTRFIASRFP
jgi:hypothetical protein